MKRISQALVIGALVGFGSMASAQGVYVEAGYTPLSLDARYAGVDISSDPSSLRGLVGYELGPFVAVEGMISFGVADDDISGNGISTGLKGEVDNMFGAYIKPKFPVTPEFDLFGRLGFASTKLSVAGDSGTETSLSWGLGASYKINEQLSINGDYMTYHDKDDVTIDGFTVGVGFRF
ncbi:porin family protein [Hydrogenophaga sp. 5NK40-0174]|uniref:porin family protein n=1 Tax=Hydrogenophaga sp. 5NK40-0174 TaxID=3127649 RepID=UPI003104CBC0